MALRNFVFYNEPFRSTLRANLDALESLYRFIKVSPMPAVAQVHVDALEAEGHLIVAVEVDLADTTCVAKSHHEKLATFIHAFLVGHIGGQNLQSDHLVFQMLGPRLLV